MSKHQLGSEFNYETINRELRSLQPDRDVHARQLMARHNTKWYETDLDDGSRLTVLSESRERTRSGALLLGNFATKHLIVIDIEGEDIDVNNEVLYRQILCSDVHTEPRVVEGTRHFGNGPYVHPLTSHQLSRGELGQPSEEQINFFEGALKQLIKE